MIWYQRKRKHYLWITSGCCCHTRIILTCEEWPAHRRLPPLRLQTPCSLWWFWPDLHPGNTWRRPAVRQCSLCWIHLPSPPPGPRTPGPCQTYAAATEEEKKKKEEEMGGRHKKRMWEFLVKTPTMPFIFSPTDFEIEWYYKFALWYYYVSTNITAPRKYILFVHVCVLTLRASSSPVQ